MIAIDTKKSILNLENNFITLTFVVILASLLVTYFLIDRDISLTTSHDTLTQKVVEAARITANTPLIIEALEQHKDQEKVSEFADRIVAISDVRFVTVMDMNRIRYSHPIKDLIGVYYESNDADDAFSGKEKTIISAGPLGESLRAFYPVFAKDGQQVGVVSVGIDLDKADAAVAKSRYSVFFGSLFGLMVGVIGAIFLSRQIKKSTFGMEPFAVAKMLEERNALLSSVREGAFAIDREGRVTLVNKTAQNIFAEAGIEENIIGKNLEDFIPNTGMQEILQTGKPEFDQEQHLNGLEILTNRSPVYVNNQLVGVVATFRDKTEVKKMAEKLVGLKNYADALRAQSHEFMNKLHVINGMIYLQHYEDLKEYIKQIAGNYQLEVGSVIGKIKDPVLAGFLLGKLSGAREAGIEMQLMEDCFLNNINDPDVTHNILTIMGNLLDNAMEATKYAKIKKIQVKISEAENEIKIAITDSGCGLSEEVCKNMYAKGYSTKGLNRGLGLYITRNSLEKLHGKMEVISEIGKGTAFHVSLPYDKSGGVSS